MSRHSTDVFARYVGAQFSAVEKVQNQQRPAIAISRQTGAGALTVANLIAQQLDVDCQGDPPCPWTVFDRNLAQRILEDHQLPPAMERFVTEDAKLLITDALESVLGLHPSSWLMRQHTMETIRRLAIQGNVILVGRGASAITAELPHVVRVRLVAPFADRVQNFANYHKIGKEKATRMVRETDEQRHRYVRTNFGADNEDPTNYDLNINTGRTGFELAARMIISLLLEQLSRLKTADVPRVQFTG